MATNQEGVHSAVRGETGTSYNYQGDWHALFDSDSIASGTFNERLLAWINAQLSTSYAGLPQAMQAFAEDQGFDSWSAMNTFSLFDISDLFASGEDGAWYDPSDLTSMYVGRDGSGGNPGVGDVVGVILDKKEMGGKTAENFIAGQTELADTFADTGSDWSISGTTLTGLGTAGGSTAYDDTATVAGQYYIVTYTVTRTSGLAQSRIGNTFLETIGSSGARTFVVAAADAAGLRFTSSGSFLGTIEVETFKALPGNHAVAPSDAARPVLRDEIVDGTSVDVSGQSELVTNGTFDSDVTGWSSLNATLAASSGELELSAQSASPATATQSILGLTVGRWYLVEATYRQAGTGGTAARVSFFGSTTTNNSSATPVTDQILVRATSTSATLALQSFGTVNTLSYFDNVTVKEVPASAARRYYLETDGTDDRMTISPVVDLITGANWTHVGGWQIDADIDSPFGLSDQSMAPLTVAGAYNWYYTATLTGSITNGSRSSPHVLTIYQPDADNLTGRHNGTTGSTVNPYDGSSPTAGLTLFSRENDVAAVPMDGRFYGGMWIDRQLTSADLDLVEEYMAGKTGATLA